MSQPRRLSHRAIFVAALAFVAIGNTLAAQCPEGTPPPCKSASPAAGRRVYPALNPRAWIVVPFGNVTKSPALDWLRDASVNLLSLDLNRWSDITVINDKRIGDLVRELPSARTAGTLTLSDGLTLAKRAGAGMLVMGDYFRYGKSARLVANVFDVRTGNKMRSVEQQASDQDALLTAFTLDSTFALAHYKLSLVYGWRSTETARTDSLQRQNAVAAVRFGASLPARERALMAGQLAAAQSEYSRACEIFRPLVAKDSTDVEALYQLGACSFHDFTVDPSPTDSTIGRFRQSWNTAFRSFRKVLRLDPGFHIAYTHFVSLSTFYGSRYGCPHPDHGRFCSAFEAILHMDGDSLIESPINAEQNPTAWRDAAVKREVYDRAVVIAGYAPPGESSVVAADAYLILRDSVAALRALRFFVDSAIRYMPLFSGLGDNNFPGSPLPWVRGMLQRADLAAALGYKDEARMWYTRVLDLWAEADMDVQPTVVRIRAAVTALGPPQK